MQNNGMEGAKFTFNAADYVGVGSIYVPVFEQEILDLTRQRGIAFSRVRSRKATGHPTRYFEKLVHTNQAGFIDPKAIASAMNSGQNRVENSAKIRAIVNGITFGKFDVEVSQDQNLFNDLQAEDLQEMVLDILRLQDGAFWQGAAANLMDAGSSAYCGLLNQITLTGSIATGTRITQGIKTQVASMMAVKGYDVKPTAVYCNPLTLDAIEAEENTATDKTKFYDVEIVAGTKVMGIMTAAGILPIITDPYLDLNGTVGSPGKFDHKLAILSEGLLERHYVGADVPRLYQMGTVADLAQKFVAIQFDTVIAKGVAAGAHAILTASR